jgi:hypothetical protein
MRRDEGARAVSPDFYRLRLFVNTQAYNNLQGKHHGTGVHPP